MALGHAPPWWESTEGAAPGEENTPYPMDYYSRDGGPWTSSYMKPKPKRKEGAARRRRDTPVTITATGESEAP